MMGPLRSTAFHARLNSPQVVPAGWHRRNTIQYEMLSYVNHIIALQLAGDWEHAALFALRAGTYLASPNAEYLNPQYRALVLDFLHAFIADTSHEDLGKFGREFVDEAQGILVTLTGA